MPTYPKSQSLRRNREDKPTGGGLKRTSQLVVKKEMRQVSDKRARKLAAAGLPLTTFGKGTPKERLHKVGTFVRRGKPFRKPRPLDKPRWGPKATKVLRKIGRRGLRLLAGDIKWRNEVWKVWEVCPITGYDRASKSCEAHHCYDKSARDDWRHQVWNGLILHKAIHGIMDNCTPLKEACERIADENRAAAATPPRRPGVTPEEARSIILSAVPDLYERIGRGRRTKGKSKEVV
jgi:hypothetical protein